MPATADAHASVATDKPDAYLRQLCRHFGHKVSAQFEDRRGVIRFDGARVELDAAGPGTLEITLRADSEERRTHFTEVVASHLERFGARDGLRVSWES